MSEYGVKAILDCVEKSEKSITRDEKIEQIDTKIRAEVKNCLIPFKDFVEKLDEKIKSNQQLYNEILITVLKNPGRYTGIFRASNSETKLLQSITQSREIKFGDFMEEIVTVYLGRIGYKNLKKKIGVDEKGNSLSADQVFIKGDTVYLIEQKIRDDHDSTKKRGQFANFKKKYECLQIKHRNQQINATMWFIDPSLVKNRKYYEDQIADISKQKNMAICYGEEILHQVQIDKIWNELVCYLTIYQECGIACDFSVPNFGNSQEILEALKNLRRLSFLKKEQLKEEGYKGDEHLLLAKLFSDEDKYKQLRDKLFGGDNCENLLGLSYNEDYHEFLKKYFSKKDMTWDENFNIEDNCEEVVEYLLTLSSKDSIKVFTVFKDDPFWDKHMPTGIIFKCYLDRIKESKANKKLHKHFPKEQLNENGELRPDSLLDQILSRYE